METNYINEYSDFSKICIRRKVKKYKKKNQTKTYFFDVYHSLVQKQPADDRSETHIVNGHSFGRLKRKY